MKQYLTRYGHTLSARGPGSMWLPPVSDRVIFGNHSCSLGEVLSEAHFDVFVKYGYAKMRFDKKHSVREEAFWTRIYDKMQHARIGSNTRPRFDALIESFRKRGFNSSFPIAVDRYYELLDGSHRLACSAALGINPSVVVHTTPSHEYRKQWFIENGFTANEIRRVEAGRVKLYRVYREIRANDRVGIIWGMALPYWNTILKDLSRQNLRRAFLLDLKTRKNAAKFIKDTYRGDGMSHEHIIRKAGRLSRESTKVGLVVMRVPHREVLLIKKSVRAKVSRIMPDYFFDCVIHFIDDIPYGISAFNKLEVKK